MISIWNRIGVEELWYGLGKDDQLARVLERVGDVCGFLWLCRERGEGRLMVDWRKEGQKNLLYVMLRMLDRKLSTWIWGASNWFLGKWLRYRWMLIRTAVSKLIPFGLFNWYQGALRFAKKQFMRKLRVWYWIWLRNGGICAKYSQHGHSKPWDKVIVR